MKLRDAIQKELERAERPLSAHDLMLLIGHGARTSISSVLSKMLEDGEIGRIRNGRKITYESVRGVVGYNSEVELKGLDESKILFEMRDNRRFFDSFSESARSAFEFAFPEMLNNAIDHSGSDTAIVRAEVRDGRLIFEIRDFGVGVFRNVMRERGLLDELEAAQDLLKGKVTTAPRMHSGEGIFFTSKLADVFELSSYGYKLRVDNLVEDVFMAEDEEEVSGTKVYFEVSVDTDKHVSGIFRSFASDPEEGDFDKTAIVVKLYQRGSIYVSRSQARRLLVGMDKFRKVIVDFRGILGIGQGFADEIFRVFKERHPEIIVEPINMNDPVRFMVERAINTIR